MANLGGSGGMPPQKNFDILDAEVNFGSISAIDRLGTKPHTHSEL